MKRLIEIFVLIILIFCCVCGCSDEEVISNNAPIETEAETTKELVINKPDSREKVLFKTRVFKEGKHEYKVSMYGMQSAEDEEKFSDFRIELRDDKNFLMLNTPLDMGEYGDSLFVAESGLRAKCFQLVGLYYDVGDKQEPLFAVQLTPQKDNKTGFIYRSFFKIIDGKIEYLTLKDEKADSYVKLSDVRTLGNDNVMLYGDMEKNEIWGNYLVDDFSFGVYNKTDGYNYKSFDFTEDGNDYRLNLVIKSAYGLVSSSTYNMDTICEAELELINKKTQEKSITPLELMFSNGDVDISFESFQMKTNSGVDKTFFILYDVTDWEKSFLYLQDGTIVSSERNFDFNLKDYSIDGQNFIDESGKAIFKLGENNGAFSIINAEIPSVRTESDIYYGKLAQKFINAMNEGTVSSLFPAEYQHYYKFLDECEFEKISFDETNDLHSNDEYSYMAKITYLCTKSANKEIIKENEEASLYIYMSDSLECPYVTMIYDEESNNFYVYRRFLADLHSNTAEYLQAYMYECLNGDLQSHDKITLDANDKDIIEKIRLMCAAIMNVNSGNIEERKVSLYYFEKFAGYYDVSINVKDSEYYSSKYDNILRDPYFEIKRYYANQVSFDETSNKVVIDYYADPLMLFKVKRIEYTLSGEKVNHVVSTKVLEDNGGEVGFVCYITMSM